MPSVDLRCYEFFSPQFMYASFDANMHKIFNVCVFDLIKSRTSFSVNKINVPNTIYPEHILLILSIVEYSRILASILKNVFEFNV